MSELLRLYEEYLISEKKASANTVSSYLRDIHQFEAAVSEWGVELTQVTTQDVERYAASMTRRSISSLDSLFFPFRFSRGNRILSRTLR